MVRRFFEQEPLRFFVRRAVESGVSDVRDVSFTPAPQEVESIWTKVHQSAYQRFRKTDTMGPWNLVRGMASLHAPDGTIHPMGERGLSIEAEDINGRRLIYLSSTLNFKDQLVTDLNLASSPDPYTSQTYTLRWSFNATTTNMRLHPFLEFFTDKAAIRDGNKNIPDDPDTTIMYNKYAARITGLDIVGSEVVMSMTLNTEQLIRRTINPRNILSNYYARGILADPDQL
jgi:hypothetical protein